MKKYSKKGKLLISVLIIVLAVTTMVVIKKSIITERPLRNYDEIASDTLIIVTDLHTLKSIDGVGSISEFDYELAGLIGKESGLKYKIIVENSLEKSLEGLDENRYDIVARPIIVSEVSKKRYLFSGDISEEKQVLVQRKEKFNNGKPMIETPLDLGGKKVHVIDDESVYMIINHLATETGDSIFIRKEPDCGAEQLVVMVADSVIDYAVCDRSIAEKMAGYLPQIDISIPVSFSMFHSWGMRKSSAALKDSLDSWTERVKTSDEFHNLLNKYGIK